MACWSRGGAVLGGEMMFEVGGRSEAVGGAVRAPLRLPAGCRFGQLDERREPARHPQPFAGALDLADPREDDRVVASHFGISLSRSAGMLKAGGCAGIFASSGRSEALRLELTPRYLFFSSLL